MRHLRKDSRPTVLSLLFYKKTNFWQHIAFLTYIPVMLHISLLWHLSMSQFLFCPSFPLDQGTVKELKLKTPQKSMIITTHHIYSVYLSMVLVFFSFSHSQTCVEFVQNYLRPCIHSLAHSWGKIHVFF